MPDSGLWHFIQWIHYLALTFWIGGITFLAGVVAPVIHHSMASRAVAGDIVGKILKRLNRVEIISCFFLLFTTSSALHFVSGRDRGIWYMILMLILMGFLTAFYVFHLTPRMESLKEKIPALEMLSSSHAAKIEFDRLHRIYVKLMCLNLVLGMMVLYGSVVILS